MVVKSLARLGIVAGLLLLGVGAKTAQAEELTTNLVMNESVAIDVPSAVSLDLQASNNGTFGQTNFTIASATNNPSGYTITLSTNSVDLVSDTLDPDLNDYPTIPALTEIYGGRTAAEFAENASDTNRWGISIDNTTSYNPIALNNNLVKETYQVTGVTPDETTINIGGKVDYDTPNGSYSTTLNFAIVANPVNPDFGRAYRMAGKTKTAQGYYKMQDMTPAICSAADEHSEIQVQDIRDNKIYWILKAKDGKCWMTQNLDLNLETTPTNVAALTSENTDLNTWDGRTSDNKYTAADGYSESGGIITWTPPRDTLVPNASGGLTWSNDQNFIKSVDVGNWFETDTYFVSSKCPNAAGCNYLAGNDKGYYYLDNSPTAEQMHYHVGNNYNWISAVATNTFSEFNYASLNNTANNPKNSICPKGWRLPINSNTTSEDDFVILGGYYPTSDPNKTDLGIMSAPLYFIRGGVARDNTMQYVGQSGSYYSSTPNGANTANLDYSTTKTQYNRNDQAGWRGRNVRCVAR